MKLTLICPGIRTDNWIKSYNSIGKSFSGEYEVIFIGPHNLPKELEGLDNVRFIQDFGPPLKCQQMGLVEAKGEYISWFADDGFYLPGALDEAFKLLEDKDYKTVVMGKYQEGDRKDGHMEENPYYILNNHVQSTCYFIPENTWMLNCGLLSKKILLELGGWDAFNFHTCPPGYNDLAIRLQKYGCEFLVLEPLMFSCTHLPGHAGDHGPIHDTQTLRDEPKFKEIWNHPYFSKRLAIDINNWKIAPKKWQARFGD